MFKNRALDAIFVIVRRFIYGVLYSTRFLPLRSNKVVILCYHSIGDDSWRYTVSFNNLKKQMQYMLDHYEPVTLETVEKYIKGEVQIVKPSFVVTFDDGYADIFQTKEYFSSMGIQPSVFVLGDPANANKAVMESNRKFLTQSQILELQKSGWGIGCHTMTHNDLSLLTGADVIQEVIDSKLKLEKELSQEITYIAYPLGNYTPETLSAFTTASYRMGLSMDDSYVSSATDICRVPRIGVDGSHSNMEFIATISDAAIYIRSIVKRIALNKKKKAVLKHPIRNVDVVVKYFWPVIAGTEINILETYSVLAERDWKVSIHTSRDTLLAKNVLPLSEYYRGLWIRRYVFGILGFWPRISWMKTDMIALHNFNIVPFYFFFLYTLVLKFLDKKRFTLVLVPHGGFVLYTKHFSLIKNIFIQFFYYYIGVPLINASVDAIRSVSEWEREEMLKKGIRKELLQVITNGTEKEAYFTVDTKVSEAIKKNVEEYGRYLIQMGRIEPVKNYETVIRALKFLPNDVNYIIAGPEQDKLYKQQLEKLIKSEGVESRVVFSDVVRGVDKYYLLKHAQLMVHLSLWESYGNSVHEGLSQGLFCIVSDTTGLPELMKKGTRGHCIEPHDYQTLAVKINEFLIQSSVKLPIINERNSKGVRSRSWSDVARDYAQMVVSVV
ncbi:MAG: glycosyltransferase [bacterium]|nr:glycosyltransferase [bacterium]